MGILELASFKQMYSLRGHLEERIQTDEPNTERIFTLKCEEHCSQETYNLIGNRFITTDFAGSENCSADEKCQH